MTKGKGKTPGAGGLGKHIKSVAHRERAQPAHRKHLGPLEKAKDYKQRAGRRKQRVARVKEIKRAAAMRNPDEFHVKMTKYAMDPTSGKMKEKPTGNQDELLRAAIKSGKIDELFLERKSTSDKQRAQELSASIGGLDLVARNRHTVYVDSADDVQAFSAVRHFDTTKAMLAAPAIRGKASVMGAVRVAHALDRVDDATLVRRFQRGDFDWDDELRDIRCPPDAAEVAAAEAEKLEQENEDDKAKAKRLKKQSETPLQDTRALRESLLGATQAARGPAPAVLLRMLRRAAVLEAQQQEHEAQSLAARSAREVMERAARSSKLRSLAGAVRKKAAAATNVLNTARREKLRPGVVERKR